MDNLIYLARCAIAAMRRLEAAVAAEEDAPHGETLEAAFLSEDRHFDNHQDAMRQRVAAVEMVEAVVESWGPVLGWRHDHPRKPRPAHRDADGQNFDTRRRVPVSTGGLPGALPGRTCMAVAPFENARMLS